MSAPRYFAPAPQAASERWLSDWVHLVPAGAFNGRDGRGPYELAHPHAVARASMAGGRLLVDENHATDLAAPAGRPAPARGWIAALEPRQDGIWALIEWTDTGRALLRDGAYHAVSPVLETRKDGTIVRILRASLTNRPNLPIRSLQTQQITMAARQATTPSATGGALSPTKDEIAVARVMGLDPLKLAEHRGKLRGQTAKQLGLSDAELALCESLGADPAKLARLKLASTGVATPLPGLEDLTPHEIEVARRWGLDLKKVGELRARKQQRLDEYDLAQKLGVPLGGLVKSPLQR